MAQNFRRYHLNAVGVTAADIPDAANFPNGFHTIISIRMANVTSNMVMASAYINNGTDDISLIVNAPIPAGSRLELIDGGSKIVVTDADRLLSLIHI